MKKLTKIGIWFSFSWVGVFLALILLKPDTINDMSLNEWGDFLAGVSAPLALLWLVIGYFQQGEELRLNTKALTNQQEELRRQVEETALLAKNSERQALAAELLATSNMDEIEREKLRELKEAQASFWPRGGSVSGGMVLTKIRNEGATIFNPKVHCDEQINLTLRGEGLKWESGNEAIIAYEQSHKVKVVYPFEFQITYTDKFEKEQKHSFSFNSANSFVRINV